MKYKYIVSFASEDGRMSFVFPCIDGDLDRFVSIAMRKSIKGLSVNIVKVEVKKEED